MKKIFGFACAVALFAAMLVLSAFADASGEMLYYYNGGVIVDNTWEYVESAKTLYIRSKSDGYNETGRISYAEDGAWGDYSTVIEHVVLEGKFTKVTGSAFKNHTALKDIYLSGNMQQYDGSCFEGCSNLESITVRGDDHIPGYADLKISTIIRQKALFGTKITTVALGSDSVVYDLRDDDGNITTASHFNPGTTVLAHKSSSAYEYFLADGNYTVIDNTPVNISITIDGINYTDTYEYGTSLVAPIIDGNCVVLYTDEECTVPYTNKTATESVTLYGKPLLTAVGYMVRSEGYHGLRALFKVDANVILDSHGLTIKEFGSLSIKQGGIRNELELDTNGVHSIKVYSNGIHVGSVLKRPTGGITEYAYTAVGFEKNGALVIENAEQNLFFRGYIILEDSDGNEYTCYTDIKKQNLASVCQKTLAVNEENNNELLSSVETAFIKAPLDAGAVPNYIYTKEDLLTILDTVYNDDDHYIPAQHLGSGANSLIDYLDTVYAETGTYPAMVSYDFSNLTTYNKSVRTIVADLKEYMSRGGIVSFSYHMENPTGNYTDQGLCRGELGKNEATWVELITKGTDLNTRFNEILDIAAIVLKDFDEEGYPIIWRPMHEVNGDWFWWCGLQGYISSDNTAVAISAEAVQNLWKYIYNYYTDTWGMTNLVWAYSPSPSNNIDGTRTDTKLPVLYCYPGAEYCDLVGFDWYTGGSDYSTVIRGENDPYAQLMSLGLPVAFTEFGPGGSLNADESAGEVQADVFSCRDQLEIVKTMLQGGSKLTYVLNWSGWIAMERLGYMSDLMNDETALDIYEVKDLFDANYFNK